MNNFLMSMSALLVDYYDTSTWPKEWQWLGEIVNFLNTVLPYVIIVAATAGVIYAVILGVNMAKAEDASKREEAKKRIINFVIALVITIVLILVLGLFMRNLVNWGIIEEATTTTMISGLYR